MSSRAERQTITLAEHLAFQHLIRVIESAHHAIHADMLEWARWGSERLPGCPAEYQVPAVWDMAGEPDPDRDPDTIPEAPLPPIDERRAVALDTEIHEVNFPAIWRRLAFVNYVWRPEEWSRPKLMRARRIDVASMDDATYLDQLDRMLEALE